jgi:type V secretory pathway adhesin AidA
MVVSSAKEIGRELIQVTRVLVDIKTGVNQNEKSDLYFGFALGLLYVLGKAEGFRDTDNMLGYLNSVIAEIFADELPLEHRQIDGVLTH